MSDIPSQLQQLLEEWLASLPWYRRWSVKAGLLAGGYTTLGGQLKPQAGGLGCLALIAIVILALLASVGIASCVTR